MKNRTRESCTSGSVRDEDGNILIYSARPPVYVASPCAAGIRNPSHELPKVTFLDMSAHSSTSDVTLRCRD